VPLYHSNIIAASLLRGCYEETGSVEFQLISPSHSCLLCLQWTSGVL